jgi:hypothetical protein
MSLAVLVVMRVWVYFRGVWIGNTFPGAIHLYTVSSLSLIVW